MAVFFRPPLHLGVLNPIVDPECFCSSSVPWSGAASDAPQEVSGKVFICSYRSPLILLDSGNHQNFLNQTPRFQSQLLSPFQPAYLHFYCLTALCRDHYYPGDSLPIRAQVDQHLLRWTLHFHSVTSASYRMDTIISYVRC